MKHTLHLCITDRTPNRALKDISGQRWPSTGSRRTASWSLAEKTAVVAVGIGLELPCRQSEIVRDVLKV